MTNAPIRSARTQRVLGLSIALAALVGALWWIGRAPRTEAADAPRSRQAREPETALDTLETPGPRVEAASSVETAAKPATSAPARAPSRSTGHRAVPVGEGTDLIVIEVHWPDGAPAAEAHVEASFSAFLENGSSIRRPPATATTDSTGRARLPRPVGEWSREVSVSGAIIRASADPDWISEEEFLDAPFPLEPAIVVLRRGGALRVFVADESASALRDHDVHVSSLQSPGGWPLTRVARTDENGIAYIAPVQPGHLRVQTFNPFASEFVSENVSVAAAEIADVELILERGGRAIAAAGEVLDESGKGLATCELSYRVDAERWSQVETVDGGRFEIWTLPGSEVSVHPGTDLFADAFEPESATVPFGTRNLVFRRSAVRKEVSARLAIVDGATGEDLPKVSLTLLQPGGDPEWNAEYALRRGGEFDLVVPDRKPLTLRVRAPLYFEERADLTADFWRPGGPRLRIAMRRGFDRVLAVSDHEADVPLLGASAWHEGRCVGAADESGRIHIVLDRWPEKIEVRCAAFQSREWRPESDWSSDEGSIELSRIQEH